MVINLTLQNLLPQSLVKKATNEMSINNEDDFELVDMK